MNVLRAIRIDESCDLLNGGATNNFLVLGTEQGHEIRIRVEDESLQLIINAIQGGPTDLEAAPVLGHPLPSEVLIPQVPTQEDVLPADGSITQEEAENTPIAWNELDDNVLSPVMKAAFFKLRAPMLMSPRAIMALVEDISSKFTSEDWREVTGQDVIVEPPAPAPTQKTEQELLQRQNAPAAVRRMQWADGSPMMSGSVSGRTVPKDEMGYPIVDGEVDAGEVVGHGSDIDEDGVGQL